MWRSFLKRKVKPKQYFKSLLSLLKSGDSNDKLKIKLVAIAKDEGAYIAEWVHHHLYFGFDYIDIYVNRTTDNTVRIIEKIRKKYPLVNCYSGDFVDLNSESVMKEIQRVIYSISYDKNKDDFTHILYLDIDEFWTPIDFLEDIYTYVRRFQDKDVISFEWMNKVNESSSFSRVFDSLNYMPSRTIKTLFKTNLTMTQIGIHNHKFKEDGSLLHVLADGSPFERSAKSYQQLKKDKAGLKKHFIYHRMYRSEAEYLALLLRGNPVNNSLLKLNRPGYLGGEGNSSILPINKSLTEKHDRSYIEFIRKCNISNDISNAERRVLKKSDRVLNLIPRLGIGNTNNVRKVFSGLTSKDVLSNIEIMCTKNLDIIFSKGEELDVFKSVLGFNKYYKEFPVLKSISTAHSRYVLGDFRFVVKDCYDVLDLDKVSQYRSIALEVENDSPIMSLFLIFICFKIKPGPMIRKDLKRLEGDCGHSTAL
ncbi:hypothetical protein EOL70_00580 [Leucothrix sargassi]|nr:hypothetical protein EOL70_00580 [Leucothrix sargassi]